MRRIEHAKPINKRALIVDDQPLFRAGLRQLLREELDISAVEAAGAGSALEVVDNEPVDIAIMDLTLGREMGFSLLGFLRGRRPRMPILVLSMHDEDVFAERSIASGANGYVSKREASDVIVRAIGCVLEGRNYVSPRVTDRLLKSLSMRRAGGSVTDSPLQLLTERELEVLRRIGVGFGSAEIARELSISTKTVESHRGNIKEKLGVTSSRELLIRAVHWLRDGFLVGEDRS